MLFAEAQVRITRTSHCNSTNRLVARAVSMRDQCRRSNSSRSELAILPVATSNRSGGSPRSRKVRTKSSSLVTTMRCSHTARAMIALPVDFTAGMTTPEPQPTHTRALRNSRIQGPSSPQASGCQECCTVRNTRSGWGIRRVTRPSRVVSPVMPSGEPLGLAG